MKGKLYGIGVGPGDPGLMTIRAKELLDGAQVIAYPVKKPGEDGTALEIIKQKVDISGKEVVELLFSMNPDDEVRKRCRAENIDRICGMLDQGKDIAMIHFKDFLRKDAGGQLAATGAGQGGMGDYRTILRFAKEQKPYVFATLENTTPENAVQCLHYLQKQYDEC